MGSMLDLKVASALMRLRLIERALHSHGEWSMEYAGVRAPVSRFHRGDRVSLVAHFPPLCMLSEPPLALSIYDGDDLVHVLPLDAPLDETGCEVWWDIAMAETVAV